MLEQLSDSLSKLQLPLRLTITNGPSLNLSPNPAVTLEIIDPQLLAELAHLSLDILGEAYIDRRLDIQGPIMTFMEIADKLSSGTVNEDTPATMEHTAHDKVLDAEAIAYHYDLSNEFYQHWLDPEMAYSCGYFRSPDDSLAQAQLNKFDHLCRKLRLQPGERLLDIGCGWGGLARHAARHYGVSVYGITLSKAQLELAREKNAESGLDDMIDLHLQDYRDLPGQEEFDKIVSVGMFEHVGHANLAEYFCTLHEQVKPGGLIMNHGITAKHTDGRPVGRGGGKFIRRYVFPNGELPHLSRAIAEMSEQGLEVVDVESLRRHYALTLEHWSSNLEASLEDASKLISDKALRIWRIYLAGCAYGFRKNWINIHQILAVKPYSDGHHDLPWTRADIYS
jgi:cyclopropane-fatty-acyl-phospholipid synthase